MAYKRNKALVNVFNINNKYYNIIDTNLKVQKLNGKSYIVVSFDKDMTQDQCKSYLNNVGSRIIKELAARKICYIKSFPFSIKQGTWNKNNKGEFQFKVLMNSDVKFNLKFHLASLLAKDIEEQVESYIDDLLIVNLGLYLYSARFINQDERNKFVELFLLKMQNYENSPTNILCNKSNCCVRIKAYGFASGIGKEKISGDISFLNSISKKTAESMASDLQLGKVVQLKDFVKSFLTHRHGSTFNDITLTNLEHKIKEKLKVDENSETSSIDFSDPKNSYCIINTIIENSVINEKYKLSIPNDLHLEKPSTSIANTTVDRQKERCTIS